ncbi:hypothetical protein CVT25_007130, partial [Psilocybe cyanescens]
QYQAQLATLSFQEREDFLHASENDVDLGDGAWVDEDEIAFSRPPLGDEGFFSSHAGGEVRLQDLFLDTLAEQKRKDHQTRKDRVERQVQAWKSMLPDLVSAFLKFQLQGPPARNEDDGSQALWTIEVISVEAGMPPLQHQCICQGIELLVNRLLEDFGPDICLVYNIMCAFVTTLKRSCFGKKMVALNLSGIVPALHGHAHNRFCQIHWHPLYVDGAGTEDFEECEHTFSCSNELASVTRLATPYHHQQHIDEHFHFHDFDKHAASGNFIYENYCQALERIEIDTPRLAELSAKLNIGAADYERYLKSERKYLAGLRAEPANKLAKATYMELLFDLDLLKKKSDDAKTRFNDRDRLMIREGYTGKQLMQITTQYRTTYEHWATKNEEVLQYEEEHNIAI